MSLSILEQYDVNEILNPYEPPRPVVEANAPPRDRIELYGEVTPAEIASLMRNSKLRFVFHAVAGFALPPMAVGVVALLLIDPTNWSETMPMAAFLVGLTIAVLVVDRFAFSRPLRARRLARRHPDLAGTLRGYLDGFGVTFLNKSTNKYVQFSWPSFSDVTVTRDGIRFDWKRSDDVLFAVPAACVVDFDEPRVTKEIQQFRQSCMEPAVCQVLPDWSQQPADSIGFWSLVSASSVASSRQRLVQRTVMAMWIVSVSGFIMAFSLDAQTFLWIGAGLAILSTVLETKYADRGDDLPYLLGQWGWFTRDGGFIYRPGTVSEFKFREVKSLEIADTQMSLVLPDESRLLVTPDDLPEDSWTTLSGWINEQTEENK